MDKKQLTKVLKKKYGKLTRFCKLAGLEPMQLQRLMATQDGIKRVQELFHTTPDAPIAGEEIHPDTRRAIFLAIIQEYRNVNTFVKSHQQFSNAWISRITTSGIKTQTKKFKEICRILKIKAQ